MKDDSVTVYLCGVDWQHELGQIATTVFGSTEALKKSAKCWKGCGIVKLKVTLEEWVEPQDMEEMIRSAKTSDTSDKE